MKNLFKRFVREEEGQDLIEYALVAALITLAAIGFVTTIGVDVATMWSKVDSVTGTAAS